MNTIPLGQTGVQVSALCLGAMYFGTRVDEETSFQLLDAYFEQGGRFIDTANIYAWWVLGHAGGESENLLGKWLSMRANRAEIFLATKAGFEMCDVQKGLSAGQIVAECHKSLQRLKIDTVDLYYAHCDDRNTPVEETMEAFYRLIKAGKVRFIGASNFNSWRLEESHWTARTHHWPEYCCVQQRHTYLRPKPGARFDPQIAANSDLLDYCRSRNLTLLAFTPLLEGSYTREDKPLPGKYTSEDSKARLRALHSVATEMNASPNQIVLAWMLKSQPPVIPVFGVSTVEQLRENLTAQTVPLGEEQMERLNKATG
jgi:aryl-alcohol dehydrogenase-like predicted oxidoreductase